MKKLFILSIILNLVKISFAQDIVPLKADFDFSPKFITTNDLTITFTDKSTGPIKDWYWDFGDGVYVTTQNPSHKYSQSGVYPVALTVLDISGNSNTKIVAVDARIFIPDFSFSSLSGKFQTDEEIQFSDKTPNVPETWLWDFGDGTTSSDQNPKHIYINHGNYNVRLTVTKLNTTKSTSKAITILISKLMFAGHIVDANSNSPLANITIHLYKEGSGKLASLMTDGNGDFSTNIKWNGESKLGVFVYDLNQKFYIPAMAQYDGNCDELIIKAYLKTNDKFRCIPVYLGSSSIRYNYDVEWSYLNNGKELSQCRELYFISGTDWRKTGCYFGNVIHDYFDVKKLLSGISCQDVFIRTYMRFTFEQEDFDPEIDYTINSKFCSMRIREQGGCGMEPWFEFLENTDFIMLGETTKTKDLSICDVNSKYSKLDINWGDGIIENYKIGSTYPSSHLFNHTYTAEGDYKITFTTTKTYYGKDYATSLSKNCKVMSCSSNPFQGQYTYNDKLINISDNITKVSFNYDDMLSAYYPGCYKPFKECIMEACNQIKIGPNSILGQTLGVPLTLRIITNGSVIKSAKANKDDSYSELEEPTALNNENNDVLIYPNPASRLFTIKVTGKNILKSYELFNNVGNCVKKENCNGSENHVDISTLPSGVYLVKVLTQDKLVNTKIIIE
jgi:PKD repeat protein